VRATHCVVTSVPQEYSDQRILDRMHGKTRLAVEMVSRILSGADGQPTGFVRIVCKDAATAESLIKYGIIPGNRKFKVVPAKKQTRVLQCYTCQGFGHHSSTTHNY
jgi:hypothetical protein